MASLNFDATTVQPDTGFELLPAGWYNAMIDESAINPTKDGVGAYLQLRFSVIDGQYQGRKVFARLNIRNANQTAQEIAYKQLSAIAHSVGVLQVQDSSQLHGIPLKIRVRIRKDPSGQYEDQNEINGYKNINEAVQGQAAAFAPAAPAMPAAPAGFAPVAPVAAPVMPQAAPQPAFAQPAAPQPWAQPAAPLAQPAPQPALQPAPAPQAAPVAAPWANGSPQQPEPTQQRQAQTQQTVALNPEEAAAVQQAQTQLPPWQQPQQ